MVACTQHGTNIFGMKLGLWTSMDGTGSSKVLGATLYVAESEENFFWAGQCFERVFREPPRVLLTDSDLAMKAAFGRLWPAPRTKHDLCIWHLSKCETHARLSN